MSKPNKAGELQGVKVDAISLVPKAANKERFKIFKSADPESIKKGAVADALSIKERGAVLNDAYEALQKVLGIPLYYDDKTEPETDPVKIAAAIEDFKSVALEIFLGNTNIIEKTGRKISTSRLTKLKDIQTLINDVMSGLDDDNDGENEGDLAATVKSALKPVTERIKNLEKSENTNAIKQVVENAISPLVQRLARVEKARGFSQRIPEDTSLQKNCDIWGDELF